jgi:hypothetical protein
VCIDLTLCTFEIKRLEGGSLKFKKQQQRWQTAINCCGKRCPAAGAGRDGGCVPAALSQVTSGSDGQVLII